MAVLTQPHATTPETYLLENTPASCVVIRSAQISLLIAVVERDRVNNTLWQKEKQERPPPLK